MVEAWKLAQERIKKAQLHQKRQHDKSIKHYKFSEGDVVFLYDHSLKQERLTSLQNPFVVLTSSKGWSCDSARVTKPKSKLIRVAFHRLRHCPKEISDIYNGSKPVQKQIVEESKKLDGTFNVANGLSNVNDNSAVKKANNLVSEDSTTDVPAEESTIDFPKEELATSTREERTIADGKAKASGKGGRSGSQWKNRLRPRKKKVGRQGRATL